MQSFVSVGQGLTGRLPTKLGANHFAPIMRFWFGWFHAPQPEVQNGIIVSWWGRFGSQNGTFIACTNEKKILIYRRKLMLLHFTEKSNIYIQLKCLSFHCSIRQPHKAYQYNLNTGYTSHLNLRSDWHHQKKERNHVLFPAHIQISNQSIRPRMTAIGSIKTPVIT